MTIISYLKRKLSFEKACTVLKGTLQFIKTSIYDELVYRKKRLVLLQDQLNNENNVNKMNFTEIKPNNTSLYDDFTNEICKNQRAI